MLITIITPSYRIDNLAAIKDSINFDHIREWIIVYDGTKITENPHLFAGCEKIREYVHHGGTGISGNPQRNYALDTIPGDSETWIYFLDDDNIVHPDFWKLLTIVEKNHIYTFDQHNRINGNKIGIGCIDTAMFLVDWNICKNLRWIASSYEADYFYIRACYDAAPSNSWVYINNTLCYYNIIGASETKCGVPARGL